ncbi:MAG: PD-(D/E)XK nuclease family protein [Bacteroidales bacterium]|nr:PD-(D/E)XK nuclease family protein [Bacteroidales bacterium]
MNTFLGHVAQRIYDSHGRDTGRVLVVMNNRRSIRFFQKEFVALGKTAFLPRTIAIDDLIADLSGLKVVQSEFLLFELYRIHMELGGDERKYQSFEDFISFGELMIGDFSEIDQYRVDARQLFSNLHDLKRLGEWDIEGSALTDFQKRYLDFYRTLYDYYERLHESLVARGEAYSGMAYRHVADNIDSLAQKVDCDAIYFVGFNALSRCEEAIIGHFVSLGKGHLLTDHDVYYLNPEQEAGLFLRRHMDDFPELKPDEKSHFTTGTKSITVVECPEAVLQCKYTGMLLSRHDDWLHSNDEQERTAIVLADESLLMPTLGALPEGNYGVNISMGYAYSDSQVHTLAMHLMELYRRHDKRGYYHTDLLALLSDRAIGQLMKIERLRQHATDFLDRDSRIRCTAAEMYDFLLPLGADKEICSLLFPEEHPSPDRCLEIMRELATLAASTDIFVYNNKERQALGSMVEIVDYIVSLQSEYHYITTLETLENIYQRLARRHTIDLLGEPLSGLQILGVLETRNLDFKRVVMLSANEGVLPAGRSGNTLIPYALKHHFGLPTYEEKDSVYAHHFYRLLHSAEEVFLLYSSESEGLGKGEPSRFIRQVEHELAPQYGSTVKHDIAIVDSHRHRGQMQTDAETPLPEEIHKRIAEIAVKGLAPTAFYHFIECPLRYYYTRILRITKEDSIEEDLDASQLGDRIHAVLQHIYTPYVGGVVSADGLKESLENIGTIMEKVFGELYLHGRNTEGRNHFYFSVAHTQISNLLRKEIDIIEHGHKIEIVGLEQQCEYLPGLEIDGMPLKLKGTVDRIDMVDGQLRIIDYKTGSLKRADTAYRDGGTWPEKWFQLMCYALLFSRSLSTLHSPTSTLHAGIYPLRNLQSNVQLATWNDSPDITMSTIQAFEEELLVYCRRLIEATTTFQPTQRKTSCTFCDVKDFCPARP